MRAPVSWSVFGFGLIVLWSEPSSARSTYPNQIPNAPASCNTCHTRGGGSARNDFGLDVQATLSAGRVDWSAVFDLDSDGDGYTNGQELADPDGNWRIGDPTPTGNTSRPGDASSTLCDNGTLESDFGETCDLDDFGGETCESQGFVGGTLNCESCRISTAGCNNGMTDMGVAEDMGATLDLGGLDDMGTVVDMGGGAVADAGSQPSGPGDDGADDDDADGCQSVAVGSWLWMLLLPLGLRRRRSRHSTL